MLKGYKTYLTGFAALIGALTAYLSGDIEGAQAAQLVVTAMLAMFMRSGINSAIDDVR